MQAARPRNTLKQETTLWETTGTPGLYVRRPGGTFYARIPLNGKRSWRSLRGGIGAGKNSLWQESGT